MKKLFVLGLAMAAMASCSDSDDGGKTNNPYKPIELSRTETEISEASNSFGWKLAEALVNEANDGDNVIYSPLSASIALAMTANGADGNSRDEIISALGYPTADIEIVNGFCHKMLAELPAADKSATFEIANSFWYTQFLTIRDGFASVLGSHYGAPVSKTDNLVTDVNQWVKKATHSCIPKILEEGQDATASFVNALYFKGSWKDRFDKSKTAKDTFYGAAKENGEVEFMHDERYLNFAYNDVCSMATLDFGNGAFQLSIILPDDGRTPKEIVRMLKSEWPKLAQSNERPKVVLSLPKFDAAERSELSKPLQALGINDAFDAKSANFSNMCAEPQYISFVRQACTMSLDEEGAVAAAATATGMETCNPDFSEPVPFVVNKPFVYVLFEKSTNAILQIGVINNI